MRMKLTEARVEHIALDGDMKRPDIIRFKENGPTIANERWEFTFEIPAWAMSDEDVALLRDMSFTDAKVRVVLEIPE